MTGPCPTLGFFVRMDIDPTLGAVARAELRDAWTEMLEQRGLYCGGGGGDSQEYVIASEASQATDADRSAVRGWLELHPSIAGWQVGPLGDLDQAV